MSKTNAYVSTIGGKYEGTTWCLLYGGLAGQGATGPKLDTRR